MSEQTLGEMIRAARMRRGWTQEELAGRLGVKTSYISQWETGARKWPQEYVRALSEELGLSQLDMAVAAGIIDRPSDIPESQPTIVDFRLRELIEAWPDITPQAQTHLHSLLSVPGIVVREEPRTARLAR